MSKQVNRVAKIIDGTDVADSIWITATIDAIVDTSPDFAARVLTGVALPGAAGAKWQAAFDSCVAGIRQRCVGAAA